jgi:hypothetical protein
MITFWNRREVFMGFELDQLSNVLNALTAADIPFIRRSSRHTSRSFLGALGENASFSGLQYVYVHKDDFERAQQALHAARCL